MNSSMNISNMSINQIPSQVTGNNQQANMNKGEFLNMLQILMTKNNGSQTMTQQSYSSTDSNFMELLLGSDLNNFDAIASSNVVNSEDIFNGINREEKQLSENDVQNFVGMLETLQIVNPNITKLEMPTDNLVYNNGMTEKGSNISNLINLGNYQNSSNSIPKNLNTLEDGTVVNLEVPINENQQTQSLSASAEKLISEIEGHRDKFKNKLDNQAELLIKNKPLTENQNKIITISDESTEIKSQVLSQVKDKIVFMAGEGAESNNTVKQVTMELHPHDLGKVNIKMTYENDKITVEIKALNEETQKILSSNAGELTDILKKTTEAVVNVEVKPFNSEKPTNYSPNNDQNYQQDYNQDNNQSNENAKQGNSYHHKDGNNKSNEKDDTFSQLINLRNLKLSHM